MTKKLVIAGIIVVAALWVAKKTHFMSYAATCIAHGKESVRKQIPRELELARIRNDIKQLDREYTDLFGPIAEKKVSVQRLEKELANGQVNLSKKREALLALTKAVETKETQVVFEGRTYKLDYAKTVLSREFAAFKRFEQDLAAKEKLLEAQQGYVGAALEQLENLVTAKRKLEVRLEELEANEAWIAATAVSQPSKFDSSKVVADITNALDEIENSQNVEKTRRQLEAQYLPRIENAQPNAQQPSVNTTDIQNYLNGTPAQPASTGSKVATDK